MKLSSSSNTRAQRINKKRERDERTKINNNTEPGHQKPKLNNAIGLTRD